MSENLEIAVIRTIEEMQSYSRSCRKAGETLAFVPTMGALHAGHLALVDKAGEIADKVIVSIFVNPTQFAEGEDFGSYPRTMGSDLAALGEKKVAAVFAPEASDMYSDGFSTSIRIEGPALGLETDYRPHFFGGVAIVVSKLLLAVLPDYAVFGEKDYQQLLVIKRMVQDLNIPVEIIGSETIRQDDRLALSSRNAYLSTEERVRAPLLNMALRNCLKMIASGKAPSDAAQKAEEFLTKNGFVVDYVAVRNADTLAEISDVNAEPLRLLAAARLGSTRLIDNIGGDLRSRAEV